MLPKKDQIIRVYGLATARFSEHEHPASPVLCIGRRIVNKATNWNVTYIRGFAGGQDEWEFDTRKFRFEVKNGKEAKDEPEKTLG